MTAQTFDDNWGINLEKINSVATKLRSTKQVGDALREVQLFMQHFHHAALQNRLEALLNDYRLMSQFFAQGYQDNDREKLYNALVAKLLTLVSDLYAAYYQASSPLARSHQKWHESLDFTPESIRTHLEDFVTGVVMCSLEADDVRASRLRTLYDEHHRYLQHLADAFFFSFQWSEEMGRSISEIICSPTIDLTDAQLLTTSIMLSAMGNDDPVRFKALVDIYEASTDVRLRQRALVGWALAVSDRMIVDHPKVGREIERLLSQPSVRREIMEMQQQVIFCRNAKKDNERLQQDIMPNLLKNSDFKINSMGIMPKDEEAMDEILNSENMDRKVEEMEESIRKMNEMRQQGADIYFGGFSQMKRYSFFYTLINWFLPFTPHHPQLQHIPATLLQGGLVKAMTKGAAFCESDKYSFVLGVSTIYHQLPPQIKNALQGEAGLIPLGAGDDVESNDPGFVRRMYLQDLYRFFSLCDERKLFVNPFSDENFLFITQGLYVPHMGVAARRIERLLYKRKEYRDAFALLSAYQEVDNLEDLTMQALLCSRFHRYDEAAVVYERLHELDPDNVKHLIGAAQANFHSGNYEQAVGCYEEACLQDDQKSGVLLNYAIALICSYRAEEGVQQLYKLNYEAPDDISVKRALAFGLLHVGRLEQAGKFYDELLAAPHPNAADYMNASYARWFVGDIDGAAIRIAQSLRLNAQPVANADAICDILNQDRDLLAKYKITGTELNLMADLCYNRYLN